MAFADNNAPAGPFDNARMALKIAMDTFVDAIPQGGHPGWVDHMRGQTLLTQTTPSVEMDHEAVIADMNSTYAKLMSYAESAKPTSFPPNVTPVPLPRRHNHYFKDVSLLDFVDVYRVLLLFNVTDPCLQHSIKKLLVAGGRGAGKSIDKDIQEAIDSLRRWQEMRTEEADGHEFDGRPGAQ